MENARPDQKPELRPEIGHLLLLDIVGYSKLLVNEQIEFVEDLNKIVRQTAAFRRAEASGRLVRLPTGDGMALIFYENVEEPARCALEISEALQTAPHLRLRMGIHSGPVNLVRDVNDRENAAGAGINVAQRVMDCGDAGHILLSKHVADDLANYRHWGPYLSDLGQCEVKHGLRLHVFNLATDTLGNHAVPSRLKRRVLLKAHPEVRPVAKPFAAIGSAVAAGLLIVAGLIYFWPRARVDPALSSSGARQGLAAPEKSVAVLPFENLSDKQENGFFADGVQDEILSDLANVADLKVISRTSVMPYRNNQRRNLPEIAQALGVSYILEGSVQRANDLVRVRVQLVDARTDAHVWGQSFERDPSAVFSIQSEIAEKVVAQLKAKLSTAEKASIERRPTSDLGANDLYAQAKVLLASTVFSSRQKEDLLEAIRLLDQAVARDSEFQLAYAQLARAHDKLFILGIDPTPQRLALAEAAVEATERLGPGSGEAHLARANHLYCGYLDYDRARQELAMAERLLPNEPLVYELSGFIDRRQGRWNESVNGLIRASELDPQNIYLMQQLAITYQYLRRFPEMAAAFDRALRISPRDPTTRINRALVDLLWKANPEPMKISVDEIQAHDPEALSEIAEDALFLAACRRDRSAAAQALAALPKDGCYNQDVSFPHAWCEMIVARLGGDLEGAKQSALQARKEVEASLPSRPDSAPTLSVLGLLDAVLGRKDDAIREGERAVELLPINKDAITGSLLQMHLVLIYSWLRDNDRALSRLKVIAGQPGMINYGHLKLHPFWDELRDDPRFREILDSLAPAG